MPLRAIPKLFDAFFAALAKLNPLLRILILVLIVCVFVEGYVARQLYFDNKALSAEKDSARLEERALWKPIIARMQFTIDSTNRQRIIDYRAELEQAKEIRTLVDVKIKRSEKTDRILESKSKRNENLTNQIENILPK